MASNSVVDNYVNNCPMESKKHLRQLRKLVKKLLPKTDEVINYGIPTYKLGSNILHIGGFKAHVSLFPGPVTIEKFADKLKSYRTSKGAIQFPINQPLPEDLIISLIKHRLKEFEQ